MMTSNTATSKVQRMPAFYIPHGAGPCFFMKWEPPDTWANTAEFLRSVPGRLPAPPEAILVVTAHWLAEQPSLGSAAQPGMLFDYYGFPPHTYELDYPAPGASQLAQRAADLLADSGLPARLDDQRGFDHGTFIPLMVMFPDARIPVLQMSLLASLDPGRHVALGRALAPLRDEGVLIIGSGMSFHNMRGYGDPRFTPVSTAFDDWLAETVALPEPGRSERLANWATASGESGRLSHPPRAEEHLLPLHVVAGAGYAGTGRRVFTDVVMETTISAFQFD